MPTDTFVPVTDALLERTASTLHTYSTVLIKLSLDREGKQAINQIGSGTLVSLGDTFGLLTAEHVSRELAGPCELGLAVIHQEHRFRIKSDYLRILTIASAEIPAHGPDLSLIVFPGPDVAAIKAVKSFYDLSLARTELLRNPPALDHGMWLICGAPDEKTAEEGSEAGFAGVKSYRSMCYLSDVCNEYLAAEYDYIQVRVESGDPPRAPVSYKGMSGGGLWQVLIERSSNGEVVPTKYLLSGVIFYESDLEDRHRNITCHGRRSIYQSVVDKMSS